MSNRGDLLITAYLRDGGTLESLAADYAIKSTRHKTLPNLVSLKYNQVDSPLSEPMVQECRGIILDEADGWRCVARGFDKFFNYGEPDAVQIDCSTVRVEEKIDGSLCMLYRYGDTWQVATSGTPDASGSLNGSAWTGTFADLFWHTWNAMGYQIAELSPTPDLTLMFELTTPHNRIIIPYADYKLTLLAKRFTNGEYVPPKEYRDSQFDVVRSFSLTSFEDILSSFDAIDPLAQEGYVVVDGKGARIKVKHPQYVAMHHMKDGASPKNFVDIIRHGESLEFLASFPELAVQLNIYKARYDSLCDTIESEYKAIKDISVQKEFALEAAKTICAPALFALRSGQAKSTRAYFAQLNIDLLMKLLTR